MIISSHTFSYITLVDWKCSFPEMKIISNLCNRKTIVFSDKKQKEN